MSQREKEIEEKIAALEKEKKILEGTKAYYKENLSYSELEELTGISIREFKKFQGDHEFPYRVGVYNKQNIYSKIDSMINTIDKQILKLRESVFGELDQLFVGKILFDHIAIIKELQWRKVLLSAPLRPRYLDNPKTINKLIDLRKGLSPINLIERSK